MTIADHECRSCGGPRLTSVLDLGHTPLADRMLKPEQLGEPEPRFPLEVVFCEDCALMQILETVDPEMLFGDDYPYFSSFSQYLLNHSRQNVLELIESRGLNEKSLVLEIASNDGYLLRNYVEQGIPVLGVDPVQALVDAAERVGVRSRRAFFGFEYARRLAEEGLRADVLHANNVLAHVADTNGFVAGIHEVLKDDGVAVIEFPYVRDLVDHCEFDTIYHEHLCYFSLTSVDRLMRRHGLYVNDVRRLPIHGGSLRIYVGRRERVSDSVAELLAQEQKVGIDRFDYFDGFRHRVEHLRLSLRLLLQGLRAGGKRIAAYGAAAKGSTLLNYVGLGTDVLEFVADKNVHKQGLSMPGQHVPIVPPERIKDDPPDFLLLLPWNLENEIVTQEAWYRDNGGRFIIPVPEPRVV